MKIHRYYRKSKVLRWLIRAYIRLFKLSGHPRDIALGFSVGILVGMSPLLGGQMAVAAFFASLFRWNPISAAMGTWITNPLTSPFIYSLTYLVGAEALQRFTPIDFPADLRLHDVAFYIHKSPQIILALFVGGALFGLPLAVFSYYLVYWAVIEYRKLVKGKIAARIAKLREKHSHRHHHADHEEKQCVASHIPED